MNITQTNNTHTTQNKQHSLTNMDTSTQELMNMLDQMKDKLKKFGMEKVALKKENNKLKAENKELKAENKELNDKVQEGVSVCVGAKESMTQMFEEINKLKKQNEGLKKQNEGLKAEIENEEQLDPDTGLSRKWTLYVQKRVQWAEHLEKENKELKQDLEEANEFIEQVYDNTGNAHDTHEYLAGHISDLEQFSLAYQEQWDAWSEEVIGGEHWVQKSQVVPEHIKSEWKNVWYCLAEEEKNCYNQEGHDPEVKTAELEDGYTYKSMRVIDEWINYSSE